MRRIWRLPAAMARSASGRLAERIFARRSSITGDASSSIAYSHDGKTLATGGADRQVKLWDLKAGRQLAPILGHSQSIVMAAFAPDDKTVLSACEDGEIQRWDAATGAKLGKAAIDKHLLAASLSPDGRWLATGSIDGPARIWDAASLNVRHVLPHTAYARAVSFSPDNQTLLTGCADKIARLWEVHSGESIGPAAFHQQPVTAAGFSSDGSRILTAGTDGICQLHQIRSAGSRDIELPHHANVGIVGVSRDGRFALDGHQARRPKQGRSSFLGFRDRPIARAGDSLGHRYGRGLQPGQPHRCDGECRPDGPARGCRLGQSALPATAAPGVGPRPRVQSGRDSSRDRM